MIKSLEELKQIREKYKDTLQNRETNEDKVKILVGMATCGIAAGARNTINAIVEEIRNEHIDNAVVVQTGCMGFCYAEPTVEVRMPNKEPVLYGKVDSEKAKEIVKRHVKNGEVIKEWVLRG
ncbi:(2Fe-2S) ferredoxin domain-containing protein [Thermobrachium celere]|uniref:NADP-reducing hydrogenase, subunit B n=1 Tax=Thermobrachium celere DSM 8682 TaxID=941824 RepID=R7RQT0_9CLOT|nr:(2Fe-2S) ferredoxin domain-containing protein [Thermobrachium celere]GFR34371.1 hypothetical protein TCEA9_01830 [Thermobrachium celere]CDF58537.1 NADP-reducing hydrogenase, subunit B [Thermobrachium celere DSM 8682]